MVGLATMLALGATGSRADAFSNGEPAAVTASGAQTDSALAARLDKLERELHGVRGSNAPQAGGLLLPTSPDQAKVPSAAMPPGVQDNGVGLSVGMQPYVLLGQVNGRYLIRQGDARMLLTKAELAEFVRETPGQGKRRLAISAPSNNPPSAAQSAGSGTNPATVTGMNQKSQQQVNQAMGNNPPAPPPISAAPTTTGTNSATTPNGAQNSTATGFAKGNSTTTTSPQIGLGSK